MKNKRIDKAYEYLKQNKTFNWNDFIEHVGWTSKTAKAYRSKKFKNILTFEGENCKRNKLPSKEEFNKLFQQATAKENNYDIYLNKSIDLIASAVGIYNNPHIKYKADTSITLILTGYIDLFIAFCIKESLTYIKGEQIHSLKQLLETFKKSNAKRFFTDFLQGMSANILKLATYRNEFVHNYTKIPQNDSALEDILYRYLFPSIINYNQVLKKIFNQDISILLPLTLQFLDKQITKPKFSDERLKTFFQDDEELLGNRHYTAKFYLVPNISKNNNDYPIQLVTDPEHIKDTNNIVMALKEVTREEVFATPLCESLTKKLGFKILPRELCKLAKELGWRNKDNTSNNETFYHYNTQKQASYTKHTEQKILDTIHEKDITWFKDVFNSKTYKNLEKYKQNS